MITDDAKAKMIIVAAIIEISPILIIRLEYRLKKIKKKGIIMRV